MNADWPITNVLEILVPIIGIVLVATPVVIAVLKRRWLGPLAAVVGVGSVYVVFKVEPSPEFQDSVEFWVTEKMLSIGIPVGIGLMLFSAMRPARKGSWWDHRYPLNEPSIGKE